MPEPETPADNPADRRRFPRVPIAVKVLFLNDRRPGVPVDADAVDVSEGGFGLIVDTLVLVDSYLLVSSAREPDTGVRVQARVVSRTPVGCQWRIGCEFARPVTEPEIQIFLQLDDPPG